MSFLLPETGLLFWMLIAFGILFVILYKYGFPAIISMIEERKRFIDDAIKGAREANEKIANVERQGKEILDKAREEQAQILREAAAMRDRIIKEAKAKAASESEKMLADTRLLIEQEKEDALRDARKQVAELSIVIAEKVVRRELSAGARQQEYAEQLLDDLSVQQQEKKE